jgi:hypothetical protein
MLDTEQQYIERRRAEAYSDRLGPSRGFVDAFRKEHGLGRENWAEQRRRWRLTNNLSENAPRIVEMVQGHPVSIRIAENLNPNPVDTKRKKAREVRKNMGMGLEPAGNGRRLGQLAGAITSDLTTDNSRGFWWLLNALQATGAVLTEYAYGKTAPQLFGTEVVKINNEPLFRNEGTRNTAERLGLVDADGDTKRGVRLSKTGSKVRGRTHNYVVANYAPTDVNSLLIPSGVAINLGLGLMSPFGGATGYEAALPSEEDKTKTSNVIGEVAAKYFLGRTGNLLPYDEFVKVRPDVSRAEYNAYKAFKYDKKPDLNPLDGDITVPTGVVKFTDEGIHGPELQFLGRGLPVTTGILPFVTSVTGTALGVKQPKRIRGGLIGGTAGLVGGELAGIAIEADRRRRNKAENERNGEL